MCIFPRAGEKMSRECRKRLTIALIMGLSVTMLLGLFSNRAIYGELPDVRIAYEPILGVGHWGYVLPWLRRILYPGSASEIVWRNLTADIAIWTLVSYALILVIETRRNRMNR